MKISRGTCLAALTCMLAACSGSVPPVPGHPASPDAGAEALLPVAYAVATAIPQDPHAKDRARMQELVALACADRGDLERARAFADPIVGWRRGEALAIVARKHALAGDAAAARALAAEAMALQPDERAWARERVATEVAKAFAALGEEPPTELAASEPLPAEFGKVEAARAARMDRAAIDGLADALDRAIATHDFDLVRGAIDAYLAILGRPGLDSAMRGRAVAAVDAAVPGLPKDLQVTVNVALADALLRSGDRAGASGRVDHAAAILAATAFLAEDLAPLGAQVALARLRLGDAPAARAELGRLRAAYRARRGEIVDLRRAGSLRALAEAYARLGDREEALSCWSDALEEGLGNPNSRPRAEDLCATCVSMAVAGVAPTPAMRARIDSIRSALSDPW